MRQVSKLSKHRVELVELGGVPSHKILLNTILDALAYFHTFVHTAKHIILKSTKNCKFIK